MILDWKTMGLSRSELKRLWAKSGNQCAAPNCKHPLVVEGEVIGEMCHILGRNPGSNRYDSSAPEETVESAENVILLCPNHHTLIDRPGLEDKFGVDVLMQWKLSHESQASSFSPSEDMLDDLLKGHPSFVGQTMINSPGGIQSWGDVTVNTVNPEITLIGVEGDKRPGFFGKTATLVFGSNPPGPLIRKAVRIQTENPIEAYTLGITGTGLVSRTSPWVESLSEDGRVLVWGDEVVQATNYMQVRLSTRYDELGTVCWSPYVP